MTDPADAFWRFSLKVYRKPGVPAQCLNLQDQYGADVNMLLYLMFLSESGTVLDRYAIARLDCLVQGWRQAVVHPLRAARRALKMEDLAAIACDDGLRQRVKEAELEAERLQQHALARFGSGLDFHQTNRPQAARDSLRAYAEYLGTGLPAATLDSFLAAIELPNQ